MKRMLNPRSKNLILVLVLSLVALPFSANTLLADENKVTNSATESKAQPSDVNQTSSNSTTPEAAKGVAGQGAAALSPLAIGGIVVLAIAGIAIAADSGGSSGTAIAHNPNP